jgi:poly(hydroxyalkanoate) depolymerase family esterase
MTVRSKFDLTDATRLTREGRLGEAMAAIRRALGNEPSAPRSEGSVSSEAKQDHAGFLPPLGQTLSGLVDRVQKLGAKIGSGSLSASRAGDAARSHTPQEANFRSHTFNNAAGSRPYKLYVPSESKGHSLPLVIMLHGCTQSPDDFAAGTRMNEFAEEHGFIVAYPEQTQSANVSKCWNWFNGGDQLRDHGEPAIIAGITRQIIAEHPVDPEHVYVAGLSAGGAAAAIMGAVYPDLYAAIGVHSGLACGAARNMQSAFSAMRQGGDPRHMGTSSVPTIVFHGDSDKTVNPLNGTQIITQSNPETPLKTEVVHGKSLQGIGYTRTVQTDPSGRSRLEQWVLHGAGHAWSGGSPAGTYTEPRGPDASREMLRFFFQHHLIK